MLLGSVSTIRPIRYSDVLGSPHAPALLAAYAAECALPQIGPPNPQGQMYEQLERAGLFSVFGAYAGDRLVGFGTVITTVMPHYGKPVATVESLFVEGEHRASGLGLNLMAALERHARDKGCVAVLYSAPAGSQLDRMLGLLKSYQHTNTIYCRRLA